MCDFVLFSCGFQDRFMNCLNSAMCGGSCLIFFVWFGEVVIVVASAVCFSFLS